MYDRFFVGEIEMQRYADCEKQINREKIAIISMTECAVHKI
jgi:hypothetical protein